jgi:hypothetical protein
MSVSLSYRLRPHTPLEVALAEATPGRLAALAATLAQIGARPPAAVPLALLVVGSAIGSAIGGAVGVLVGAVGDILLAATLALIGRRLRPPG